MSESAKKRVGDKNPFFGKKHLQETREAISKSNTGKKHTEDVKRRMSENSSKSKSKKVIDTKTNIYHVSYLCVNTDIREISY